MKYRNIKLLLTLPVVVLLTACATEPTVTSSVYSKDAPDEYTVVSVCYSASDSTREKVMATALENCPGTANSVSPWDKDLMLNDCPIMKKSRVTFLCMIK